MVWDLPVHIYLAWRASLGGGFRELIFDDLPYTKGWHRREKNPKEGQEFRREGSGRDAGLELDLLLITSSFRGGLIV